MILQRIYLIRVLDMFDYFSSLVIMQLICYTLKKWQQCACFFLSYIVTLFLPIALNAGFQFIIFNLFVVVDFWNLSRDYFCCIKFLNILNIIKYTPKKILQKKNFIFYLRYKHSAISVDFVLTIILLQLPLQYIFVDIKVTYNHFYYTYTAGFSMKSEEAPCKIMVAFSIYTSH